MNLTVRVDASHPCSHGVRFSMTKWAVMELTGMILAKACKLFGKLS
jgi:hypothetical protein